MKEDNKNSHSPKHFLVFKILGILFLIASIAGIVISFINFGNFDSNAFMIGGVIGSFGFVLGIIFLYIGFFPAISKLSVKTAKYVQEINKDDLQTIARNSADISKDAITKTAKAVKNGLEETKFCKYCGEAISKDSVYCSKCGKKQSE